MVAQLLLVDPVRPRSRWDVGVDAVPPASGRSQPARQWTFRGQALAHLPVARGDVVPVVANATSCARRPRALVRSGTFSAYSISRATSIVESKNWPESANTSRLKFTL